MSDAETYAQVSCVLENIGERNRRKIPKEILDLIEYNKLPDYEIDDINQLELSDEAKMILSVIYTDYIADEEERRIIKEKEKFIYLAEEEKKSKQFSNDDIFKNNNNNNDSSDGNSGNKNEEASVKKNLPIKKKEKWYKAIIQLVMNFFGIE